jgi:hypothetical protein
MKGPFRNELRNQTEIKYDISIPAMGATKMNMAVAMIMPPLMAFQPKAAKNAPANPPINV